MTKFYDIEPAGYGSHYLLENGRPIARFGELAASEATRESFCRELIEHAIAQLEKELE